MVYHQPFNSLGNYNYNAHTYTNRDWAPHFHKNFEIIHVLEGNLRIIVDGKIEIMHEGDWALILSNQIHSFESPEHSRIWVAIFCEQFVTQFAGYIEKLKGEHSVFKCSECVNSFVVQNLINSDSSVTMKKACFYALCDEYLKAVTLTERESRSDDLICSIIDYISRHCREDITLASTAEAFGYEYHYLSRIMNRGYKINFSKIVNEYRIAAALQLIETTDKSITDIAFDSGFKSIRNFNHVFHNITGVTPRAYIHAAR